MGVKSHVLCVQPYALSRAGVVGVLYSFVAGRGIPARESLCDQVRLGCGQHIILSVCYFKRSFAHRSACNDKRNRVFVCRPVRVQRQVRRCRELCLCVLYSAALSHPIVEVVSHKFYVLSVRQIKRVVLRAVKRQVTFVTLHVVHEFYFPRFYFYQFPLRPRSVAVAAPDLYRVESFLFKLYFVSCSRYFFRRAAVYSHLVLFRADDCRPNRISVLILYSPFES